MKYKIGDKVKIKSLDWFKANEYSGHGMYDDVLAFLKMTDECCGKEFTIDFIFTDERGTGYIMKEPNVFQWRFTDSMIEGLADTPQKMVSLDKACEWLKNNIDFYVETSHGDDFRVDIKQLLNDIRKAMEE